jgi:hypothetical protein
MCSSFPHSNKQHEGERDMMYINCNEVLKQLYY